MHGIILLPRSALRRAGPVTTLFSQIGVRHFHEAARFVRALPYGRISRRGDLTLVIHEGRGTCSSKHALLAALADEQRIDVALMLGIFAMSERNTPGVGRVLTAFGLESIPEAHCYLVYRGRRIDLTSEERGHAVEARAFVHEEVIAPAQGEQYKIDRHRAFLAQWVVEGNGRGHTIDELWEIREACIAALSEA